MTPQVPGSPNAAPKKGNGCLIALGVVAAVLALFCLIGGIGVWRASQNPEVKKAFAAVGKGAKLAIEGAKAPGAEELRKAGCPQAMVLDATEMVNILQDFVDAGIAPDETPGLMVLCQGNRTTSEDELPSCEEIAQIYVKAAKPVVPFTAVVSTGGAGKQGNLCEQRFDASGAAVDAP